MRRLILSLAFLPIMIHANAQEATPLSLQQSIDYALKHNYTVKNADLDVLIQKAQINQTVAAAYPHVNGKAELDNFVTPQYQFIDGKSFNPLDTTGIKAISFTLPYAGSASVTASQVIFDGSLFVAVKARKTVMELARQGNVVTKENVRYNVTKAYHALVVAHLQFDIIKNSLKFARTIEHDITITREQGFAEKIEVERTSVQVNNLATDSMRIASMLEVSEQLLKYQIGMDINAPIVLTDTNIEEHQSQAMSLLNMKEDYNNIPSYGLLLTQLKLNEYNVQRYKLAALPSLSAFINVGSNYAHNDLSEVLKLNNYYSNFLFGIQLNMPIFNGFMRVNQLREAKLNVEKSQNSIEYAKQGISFQVAQSRTMLRNNLLQAQSQKRNLELSNDVLDLAQKKYKAGVGSNQEVTQAQTDQLRAQNNYFSALLDVVNAQADLEKALGLLK